MRFASFAVTAAACLLALTDCTQKPVSSPIRSLERSGKLALVCLDPDTSAPRLAPSGPGYPLEQCQNTYATKTNGSGSQTHTMALVNQTSRGEVAVLDVTAGTVIDVDAATPGFNFLPVGQEPVDIVATPEGTAAFVASAEVNHPGIYALPTGLILSGGPTLRAWPACALPSRPGAMTLVVTPTSAAVCGAPNWATDTLDPSRDPATLAREATHRNGDLANEVLHPGAQKLVVSLPSEGSLVVIDAQRLLDRDPGSFDPCPIERKIKLRVDLPPSATLGNTPSGPVCPPLSHPSSSALCPIESPIQVTYAGDFSPQPAVFAFEGTTPGTQNGARLFVSDLRAPVIHVVDLADPCNPVERAPLLPSSYDDPGRPVTTNAISLSPITRDLSQFLYAVDEIQGSVMVFDVGKQSSTRSPLVRPRPDFFPGSSRDRLNVGSPVRAISFFTQELPFDDGSGNLLSGVSCNPQVASTDVAGGGVYQTAPDFSSGAGPRKLRGTFALVALTSGSLVVVDVDDYDAPCRTYQPDSTAIPGTTFSLPSWMTGCLAANELPSSAAACAVTVPTPVAPSQGASGEYSCRVVDRHEVRSAYYIANNAQTGPRSPGIASFALLKYKGTTVLDDSSQNGVAAPRMRGPKPEGVKWSLLRGGTSLSIDANPYATSDDGSVQNFVIPDIREPRTAVEQDWSVTYSGPLPGSDGKVARLNLSDPDPTKAGLYDPNGGFCYLGVHDANASAKEANRLLGALNRSSWVNTYVKTLTDSVEITNPLLDEADPYWTTPGLSCSFVQCRANFGTTDNPTDARLFKIREAYQDRLLTYPATIPDVTGIAKDPIQPECCFPTLVSYQVRGGEGTWITVGGATGFVHHVISDANGQCILGGVDETGAYCDDTVAQKTGRAYQALVDAGDTAAPGLTHGAGMPTVLSSGEHGDPFMFHNAQMFFAVFPGTELPKRDMSFGFHMSGGFVPLSIALGRGSPLVAPQAIYYHPVLGSNLLVTDGALQGVVLVDLYQLAVSNSFF